MRIFLTLISILILGHINAQVSFCITPTINQKAYISSSLLPALFHSGFNHSNQFSDNPYFKINNKPISFREDIPIGLNLVLSLDSIDCNFKLGYSQDGIGSAVQTSILVGSSPLSGQVNAPHYDEILNFYKSLHYINRLSFMFSKKLINLNEQKYPTFGFNIGFSLLFGRSSSNIPMPLDTMNGGYSVVLGGARIKGFEMQTDYNGKIIPTIDFGCNVDFGVNRTRKSNLYLFTLGLNYRQGFRTNQFSFYRYYIDDGGDNLVLSYASSSKGSGIYLELSRIFRIYPRKKKLITKNKRH